MAVGQYYTVEVWRGKHGTRKGCHYYTLPITQKVCRHPTRRGRRAWRRQAPPLLYSTTGTTCIGVAALASAMPGPTTSAALCRCHQVPFPFPSGFTPFG